ncbi:MAG: hypothetical protein RL757_1501 [Bacteroidota bacterium]|jgi:phosphatidylserine/phosphatidylglycerophosphate/cardiolipin synthase-like enzyme
MELLKNPWRNVLMNLVSNSHHQIRITAPFVKENICKEIFKNKKKQTQFELITSFNLQNAFAGSLDLLALKYILDNGGVVKNYPKLHAKIYIFDESKAVITSGNLTNGGLHSNYEYGILLDNSAVVAQINEDFLRIANDSVTGTVKNEHILEALTIIENLPRKESLKLGDVELEYPEISINHKLIENFEGMIEQTLSGWKLDIFKCVNAIEGREFSLGQLYDFESFLKQKHPNNQYVKEKIRQLVQQFRDLGLIEFVEDGKYRKLWI